VIQDLAGLSKNQKRILEMLKIKPDITTKEIAEMLFGKIVEYKSKEYASVHRSLISLEKQGGHQESTGSASLAKGEPIEESAQARKMINALLLQLDLVTVTLASTTLSS